LRCVARRVVYGEQVRFVGNCQNVYLLRESVGAVLRGRTPPLGSDRRRPCISYGLPLVAMFGQLCGRAEYASSAKVRGIHYMNLSIFGEGCGIPVNVGQCV
jgi:hypothetical protein